MTTFCVPGDLIKEFSGSEEVGGGLYLHDGKLISYLAGEIQVTDLGGGKQRFEVIGRKVKEDSGSMTRDMALNVNDLVLAKVTKVMQNQIAAEMVSVGNIKLRTPAKGVVRREDMKEKETDMLITNDCFRPGDIIRAKILSFGDSRQYYLSTSEHHLGVLYATCATTRKLMVAKSAVEMVDVESGEVEKRLVAGGDQELM